MTLKRDGAGEFTASPDLLQAGRHREVMAAFGLKAMRRIHLDELLHEACILVAEGLDVEHAKILEHRNETDDLLVRAGIGWATGVVGRARLPSGMSSPPGRAFQTGAAVFIDNIEEAPEFEYSDLLREHGVVALVNVPIKTSGFTFGVLEADANMPRRFGGDDRNFLIGFANLLAAAVQRQRADTERDRLIQELTGAKSRAEAAVASKDRVLAATSHDLRQPLQTIALSLDRLALRSPEATDRVDISRAIAAAGNLRRGLDHILDVARLESGMREPRVESVELGELISACAQEFRLVVEQKGLQFRLVPTRARIRTDKELLSRILQNLISNAVKYTDHGRILLGVRRRRSDTVSIEVHDTGMGIPTDQVGKIFGEFHRLDTTRGDGVGLGLAIVRRFADLLGHQLSVRSTPGKGSCFSVEVAVAERRDT